MRPAATTHHTDSDQRFVPLSFTKGSDQLMVEVANDPSVAPPGYYMVFIVDDQGRPCERALFVRLSHERCALFTDKSHYSNDEYAALTVGGTVAVFENSLYVVIHGFIPSEVGIAMTTPNAAQLSAYAPGITFRDGVGNTVGALQAVPTAMHLEVPGGGSLDARQRITYEYAVRFTDSNMFPAEGALPDTRTINLSSSYRGYRCTGEFVLTRRSNPFMLDGPKHWLSVDLRVFHVLSGEAAPGLPSRVMSGTNPDPNAFIYGLPTIQLPDSLKRGQEFRVEIRQISHIQEQVVGTFELFIPVSTADLLLADEMRTLSVMKHIGTNIGPDSRWYPVFQRYLGDLGDRVRGFGGDPTRVDASPLGDGGSDSIRLGGGEPRDGSAGLLDECLHLLARYARLGLGALLALVIVAVAVLVVLLTT